VKLDSLVGIVPVLTFLASLLYLDSYKLVKLRTVLALVLWGALAAGASYVVNTLLLDATRLDLATFSRYVAPVVEECWKALAIVVLIRTHRIGFLVDAAILGFAAGAGFAMVENIHFLGTLSNAGIGTWIVRGFGTAIMHGGATALFGVLCMTLLERRSAGSIVALLPGLALAIALHSLFNHLSQSPRIATLGMFFVVPLVFYVVFERSERVTGDWLGKGFDADAEMLELINSGRLSASPLGSYLHALKDRFDGPVVADLLCYLRLHAELAIQAKGILMMRESGFDPPIDLDTRGKLSEMGYLEAAIGKTALLALHPVLQRSRQDAWQMYMLGK